MQLDDLKTQCVEWRDKLTDAATSWAFVNDEPARAKADEEQITKWILAEQKVGRRVFESEITRERKTLADDRAARRAAVATAMVKLSDDAKDVLAATKAASERLVPLWELYSALLMKTSTGPGDYSVAMMRMAHDQAIARVEQDLSAMTPAATRQSYAHAQAVGDLVAMEAIERHGAALGTVRHRNPTNDDIDELFKLTRDKRTARTSRWPDEARTLEAAIAAVVPTGGARQMLTLVSSARVA
jgi:hypothetical protein